MKTEEQKIERSSLAGGMGVRARLPLRSHMLFRKL